MSNKEKTYICYRYEKGEPTGGHVKVQAANQTEAEDKAIRKYRELGYSNCTVRCRIPGLFE